MAESKLKVHSNINKAEASNPSCHTEDEDEFGLPTTIVTAKQKLSKFKLVLLCIGLIFSILVAALDETIVATALNSITTYFNQSSGVTWVAVSYLLTMTAFEPLYGKFSDVFGRKIMMHFSLVTFLIGSVGCGWATSLIMLIVFRGIAGVGAGGLIALSFIIMSDAVEIESRGAYLSLLNGAFALSYAVGPLIGGAFVDHLSWRWAFWINIPIIVICMAVVQFTVPNPQPNPTSSDQPQDSEKMKSKLARIDWLGTFSLIIGIILVVLALNWGGRDYPWTSPEVLSCLIIGLIVVMSFIYIEVKVAKEPVIPVSIFTRNATLLNLITLLFGASMFVFMCYWPLYHQIINSATAIQSGVETLPLLISISGFAAVTGLLVTKTGIYRPLIWVGMAILTLGCALMFRLGSDISRAEEIIYPLLVGIGIGLNLQTCVIGCQVAVEEKDVAIVTAVINFSLTIGGVLGLAILGSIFNNVLVNLLEPIGLKYGFDIHVIIESVKELHSLPLEQHLLAIEAYREAYKVIFLSLVPFSALGLILSLFVKHIPFIANPTPTH